MRFSIVIIAFIISLTFDACHDQKHVMFFGKTNDQCLHIDTSAFIESINSQWPARKPNSISDAVKLLDTLADNNFRCSILKMDEEDLYFTIGIRIRNDWVRHGTNTLRKELFEDLELGGPDYTSGLITDIYKQCLLNETIDLVAHYEKFLNDTSKTRIETLKRIEKELYE